MAKDCMGGIRDPDWLDLPPINSLGMGVHSLANLPSNSTIKKKAAIIIMAVEVTYWFLIYKKKTITEKRSRSECVCVNTTYFCVEVSIMLLCSCLVYIPESDGKTFCAL